MATLVTAINGRKLRVKIGDGASPEVFSETCLINTSRGITFSSAPNEIMIPYCDNTEDLPSWIEREVDGLSASIAGAGMLDVLSHPAWFAWFVSGLSKNIQVHVDSSTTVVGSGYWAGAAVLTEFSFVGETQRAKVMFDTTLLSDGPFAWTDT